MVIVAFGYTIILSIILMCAMYIDKQRAIKNEWRISEKTLWLLAMCGGAVGGLVGMYLFRHKTKHTIFVVGFPVLAAIHMFLFVYLYARSFS